MKHASFHQADAVEQRRLGMAECGWRGLSEGWMLRHLGDLHWRLIATALGQQAAVFADAEGAPVYAAFCAISERILHPALARPGAMVTIASRLRRLSPKRLVSFHGLSIGDTLFAEVTLITAFVRHGETAGNAHLRRAQEDAADQAHEMRGGQHLGNVLRRLRHRVIGEHEAAQQERRQKAAQHSHLIGQQLRLRDGRYQDAPGEGAEQEDAGIPVVAAFCDHRLGFVFRHGNTDHASGRHKHCALGATQMRRDFRRDGFHRLQPAPTGKGVAVTRIDDKRTRLTALDILPA
mgnify:CR=1 FL=1